MQLAVSLIFGFEYKLRLYLDFWINIKGFKTQLLE
jgi:hypothetical protein